jgi:hypothetical protein
VTFAARAMLAAAATAACGEQEPIVPAPGAGSQPTLGVTLAL